MNRQIHILKNQILETPTYLESELSKEVWEATVLYDAECTGPRKIGCARQSRAPPPKEQASPLEVAALTSLRDTPSIILLGGVALVLRNQEMLAHRDFCSRNVKLRIFENCVF
jgi:hypothetical protein